MGFFRRQEEELALRYLKWQYSKLNQSEPEDALLRQKASQIVDEAHQIANQRGRNVLVILKEMLEDIKK